MVPIDAIEDIEGIPMGVPVIVEGGLVVTVIQKPKECNRQVKTKFTNTINQISLSRQLRGTISQCITL